MGDKCVLGVERSRRNEGEMLGKGECGLVDPPRGGWEIGGRLEGRVKKFSWRYYGSSKVSSKPGCRKWVAQEFQSVSNLGTLSNRTASNLAWIIASLGNSVFFCEYAKGSGFPGFSYGLFGRSSDMEQKFKLSVGQRHWFVFQESYSSGLVIKMCQRVYIELQKSLTRKFALW